MPPITASRVDLPRPDGPTTLTELPAAVGHAAQDLDRTGHAGQRDVDVAQLDHGGALG